jgi:hypothetical protein
VAVNRGRDKEALARSLGAHDYIDTEVGDPALRAASSSGGFFGAGYCEGKRNGTAGLAFVTTPRALRQ